VTTAAKPAFDALVKLNLVALSAAANMEAASAQ
jgi:hypothetical protein